MNDPEYLGNYTKENYSPKNLFSSTIGDELKIASGGRSDVYAVAPDPESAILSAGHAANGAFWMDNLNGKWATTTYYKGIPWYVDRYNNGPEALSARIASMVWTPSLSMDKLNAFPYVLDEIPYRYTFNEKAIDCYPRLKTSPYINKEVNRLAIQFLEYGGFGTRSCPDMLSVTYYAGNFLGTQNKEYTREIQDTYYQLDQDIEKLLDTIDKKVGLSNTLVVFTGSGYYKSEESYPDGLMVKRRGVPPQTVRGIAQHVPHGTLRATDELGKRLLRLTDLSESQSNRRCQTGFGYRSTQSGRLPAGVQWRAVSHDRQELVNRRLE